MSKGYRPDNRPERITPPDCEPTYMPTVRRARTRRVWTVRGPELYGASCLWVCGRCNDVVEPEWKFCPHCGCEIESDPLPKELRGKATIVINRLRRSLSAMDDKALDSGTLETFTIGVSEFLIYHDLISFINSSLGGIRMTLNTIENSSVFPKDALELTGCIEYAANRSRDIWKETDDILQRELGRNM